MSMCETSRPEASANWPSSFDTPRQRQIKLRAASGLDQPRPIGRHVPAGRPYRLAFTTQAQAAALQRIKAEGKKVKSWEKASVSSWS